MTAAPAGWTAETAQPFKSVESPGSERTDVAARYHVLQTPTILLIDADGAVRTRFGGPPRPAELSAALTAVLEGAPA